MIRTAFALVSDLLYLLRLMCRSRAQLAAENRFLRKQLAYYVERRVRRRRADNASRIALVLLSRLVEWRDLLTIVRPDTGGRWHRELFRLFWRTKSRRRGRPRIPADLQRLIADMAAANCTCGEERIAAELRLRLGLTVSPRTVRRYMPPRPRTRDGHVQSWATFLRNHAGAVLACDFFVVVTATFQQLYVFVVLDIATRRVIHWNLTDHPTAEWTIQQFRNGLPLAPAYRFLVHDRDGIFAPTVDQALGTMSLEVLRTPVRVPQANAYCERFIGTARRECLDWVIPLNERHLRHVLTEWIPHYNGERPHSALGPGLPDEPVRRAILTGHHPPSAHRVVASARLGGLHHHYRLEREAA
ncbi:MAG: transposase [Vicinamibacterales bacterium]